jgi:hypothetical protein
MNAYENKVVIITADWVTGQIISIDGGLAIT